MAIDLYRGGDFIVAMAVSQHSTGLPLNLTGYAVGVYRTTLPAPPMVIVANAVAGALRLSITAANTATLNEQLYQIYLVLTDPAGRKTTIPPIWLNVL